MKRFWQALIYLGLLAPLSAAEPKPVALNWEPLKVQASAFTRDLGLLDSERDEYATNLADCAAQAILTGKTDPETLEQARRLLSLALNLSPRNRRAIVVNFQLAKGLIPEDTKGDFSPPTMARLLSTRSGILANSDSQEDQLLARMFCHLAAELDPKNEDAVYASELDRLDHGNLDWTFLTRPRAATPASAAQPVDQPAAKPGAETPAPQPPAPQPAARPATPREQPR